MSSARIPEEPIQGEASGLAERIAQALAWLEDNLRANPDRVRGAIETLLPEAQAAGDASGTAWLQFFLGWHYIDADEFDQGSAILESAKTVFETRGDHVGLSRCFNGLGFSYFQRGMFDLALDYYRNAVHEAEKVGRRELAGTASMNLATCLHELEEPDEALQVIEQARKEYTFAAHNLHLTHATAALVYRSLGRIDEAEKEILEAIRLSDRSPHDSLEIWRVLAEIHLDCGRINEAEAIVTTGMETCIQAGERANEASFRLTRARLFTLKSQPQEAIADIEKALLAAKEIGARKMEADAEKALYLAWQANGSCQNALEAFTRYAALRDVMKSEQTSRRILGLHDERARREAHHFESLFRQISTVSEIGQRITANLDLETTLESLYDAINELMDAPTLLVALLDEEQSCLDYRLVMIHGQRRGSFRKALDEETLGCWCARHRRDILIENLETEYRQYVGTFEEIVQDGHTEQSLVFVPLLAGNKIVGVLSVQSHLRNAYDKRKVEVIRAIGAYIAIAIENAKLYRRVLDSEQSVRQQHAALVKAQAELKQLRGIIPICSSCKKIRDDGGSWQQLEGYIREHSDAEFTHGICPDCQEKLYGDLL